MKIAHNFYHVFWYASQLSDAAARDDFRQCCDFHATRLDEQLRAFNDDGSYIPANRQQASPPPPTGDILGQNVTKLLPPLRD